MEIVNMYKVPGRKKYIYMKRKKASKKQRKKETEREEETE